jgi:arylformamidase
LVVYGDYDRESLDRQYNCRAQETDFQALVENWRERSERLRSRTVAGLDLSYGSGKREKLDIFPARPEAPALESTPAPTLLFFHGGYWQAMDKSLFHFLAEGPNAQGINVVFANYPLAPAATIKEIVASCRRCVAWLLQQGAGHGAPTKRLIPAGHSAGGHIVAMLMAADWAQLHPARPADPFRGGLALSGVFDLEPIRLCYLNQALSLDEKTVQENSPIRLKPVCRGPLAVAVGDLESEEFKRQSREFAEYRATHGFSAEFLIQPNANHFAILDALTTPGSVVNDALLQLAF